jgi:hypothetical protein
MRKKIIVLIMSMLLCVSGLVFLNNNFEVKANPGGGENNATGLPYEFMWSITKTLANVIHDKTIYPNGSIPMGRAFATPGDLWTADYISNTIMNGTLNLENVRKIPIQNISGIEENYYKDFYYNYIVQPINFNLVINGDTYPFAHNVPINEMAVIPSGAKHFNSTQSKFSMDFINEFENARLVPMNLTYLRDLSEFADCDNLKVSYTQETFFCGLCCKCNICTNG